ncbi:MAG: hypothetical protein NVSMB20_23130 [Bradyrhizobium sp.]
MLRDDINNAVKDAMRAKEERKLSTLRMVNSTIKNADIAARGEGKPPLSDGDLLSVLQKMIKQRKDMGKVIGALKAKYAGQMDFGKASGMVKAALAG